MAKLKLFHTVSDTVLYSPHSTVRCHRAKGKGVVALQEIESLGSPSPRGLAEVWDVATKGLSLGLCRDGQNNVLNCSTDLKSKSGCDVQTPRTGNGLTSGVHAKQ